MNKQASPSISETAFNCPHCGAYAHQNWLTLYAKLQAPNNSTPPGLKLENSMQLPFDKIKDESKRNEVIELVTRISEGYPFLEKPNIYIDGQYVSMDYSFYNVLFRSALIARVNRFGFMTSWFIPNVVKHLPQIRICQMRYVGITTKPAVYWTFHREAPRH